MTDDDLIYDDTRYFRRGRSGYREDPARRYYDWPLILGASALWIGVPLAFWGIVVWIVHWLLPSVLS